MKWADKKINRELMTERAASGIARGILKSQNAFANCMQSITKKWKHKQQWLFLCIVCLAFGTLSLLAIVSPFRSVDDKTVSIPKPVTVPKFIHEPEEALKISEQEFQQVQQYKATHPGLSKERPGLLDSLNLIEEWYYSQKK